MSSTLSFDDLAAWDDLVMSVPDPQDDPEDLRRVDPRSVPADVVDLDESIAALEEKLSALRMQRAKLLDERALIYRLPPELLSRVFELSVHEDLPSLPNLNLVSRHWRELALATPTIWTYVVLDPDWMWRIPSFLRQLRVHLKRSQASKLFVNIDFRHVDSAADVETIMTELEPHLWRCYSFCASVPDWTRMRTVQEHLSGLGPTLEDLYVRLDSSESESEDPFCILTQPCPHLSYIMLEHAPLDCIKVELPALRSLCLLRDSRSHSSTKIAYPFGGLMSILTSSPLQCLTLRSAIFTLDSTEDVFKASPTPQELPELLDLTFDAVEPASTTLFLGATNLPRLEILSVNSGEDYQWLTFISLCPARFPSLRLLDLRNCNFHGPALVPLIRALHHLPQITGLGIALPAMGIVGTRLFDMLASNSEALGEWLLPRLEALCLQSCADISGHELLRVVCARRDAAAQQVSKITYLKIAQCYMLDRDVLARLTLLVDTVRTL